MSDLLHPRDLGVIVRNTIQLQKESYPYLAPYGNTWRSEVLENHLTKMIMEDIRNLDIVNFGVKIALITQLRLALIFISDNNPSNHFITCALLTSFTNTVNNFENRGLLKEGQATDLLQHAQAIQNAIGCNIGSYRKQLQQQLYHSR